MHIAFAALLGIVLLVRLLPGLPLSRLLHEWCARRPAAWLLRRTRVEVLAWAIAAGLLLFAGEYVLVMGGPQIAMTLAVELATYADALIAVAMVASVSRVRAGRVWLLRRSGPSAAPRKRRRATRRRALRPPANDDDGHGAIAA